MFNKFSVSGLTIHHLAWSVVAALSLAGCGDDTSSMAAQPAATTATVASTTAAPVITGLPETSVQAGVIYRYVPTSSDPNARVLSYDIINKPDWATFGETNGELSGTPTASDVGTSAEIEIGVSDGTRRGVVGPFRIRVIAPETRTGAETPPTMSGTPASAVIAGQPYSFTPQVNDSSGETLSFAIVNRPAWATFSTATGRFSGSPTTANVGTFANILISVSGDGPAVSMPAFSIQVQAAANNAPTISGVPAATVGAGDKYSFTPAAGDPDGNALTFSILNAPPWATFSASTGQLSGTAPTATGSVFSNIVISVSDGTLTASLATFSIQVEARPVGTPAPRVVPSPPVASSGAIKFHPGYYFELDPGSGCGNLTCYISTMASLKGKPGVVGVFLIVPWSGLEGNKGDYSAGFSLVDALIVAAKADNLQLMIGVQGKVFGDYSANAHSYGELPAYFDTTPDSTGAAPLYLSATANGVSGMLVVSPKNYDPVVTARRIALVQAYGARYDGNPNFEMWSDEDETSNGLYTSSAQYDGNVAQDIVWAAAARAAFPTSGLRLCTNFMDTAQQFTDLFSGIQQYAIAVGGPDVKVNLPAGTTPSYANAFVSTDTIVFNGFVGGHDWRNTLAFVAENQYGDIPAQDDPSYLTTLYSELFSGALGSGGSVMPNYWLIDQNQGPGWSVAAVAAWMGAAGSVNTTRPSSY